MGEVETFILSICLFAVSIFLFIFVYVMLKKRNKYILMMQNEIELCMKDAYMNIELVDGNLFPYREKLISGVKHDFKIKEELVDEVTKIKLKKRYSFFEIKVIYIVNNSLHYPLKFKEIEGKKYIILDKDIKTIELLISFDKPSHFLLRYDFKYNKDGITYKVEEEKENGRDK